MRDGRDERVLLFTPAGRDAEIVGRMLERAGIASHRCASIIEVADALEAGAGMALVSEEGLDPAGTARLLEVLERQPPWSDVPLVVLTSGGHATAGTARAVAQLGPQANLSLLERPVRVMTLVSAIRSALRARRRQYEVRDHLAERAETARALGEANRRKDEFLGMLGHELRNPLAPLGHALQLARREGQRERALDVAERQVRQLSRLVDDLLDVSRVTLGKIRLERTPLRLARVVERAIEATRHAIATREQHLRVDMAAPDVGVTGDAARLEQVFANLLTNAAKYTDRGGHITVAVARDGHDAVVSVRDTGIGIAPEMLPYVFDLFAQADRSLDRAQGGLGIGLTMVRSIVDAHGGRVEARSAGLDAGSEFVVRLPAIPDLAVEQPTASASGTRAAQPLRVLVVDDNLDGAEALAALLVLEGHRVAVAADGASGLDLARRFAPDVVLLDIGLPRLDGYQVARRLREDPLLRNAFIVAVSGYGRAEDRERTRDAGFDRHLLKPLAIEDLQRVLDACAQRA